MSDEAVTSQLASTLTADDCRELLLFAMETAQRIALEPRPEVRTSGIRLLFDIITRHGSALSGEVGRVWDMAFPLLMEVAKNVQLSDEAHRVAAGPLAQPSRTIMHVHHSRDTFTKEWLDTLDKALRGWTSFLLHMLRNVMHLPCFQLDWMTLMGVLQGLITMHSLPSNAGSRKVALSALSFFSTVVAPHATDAQVPPAMWASSWSVMREVATSFAGRTTCAHVSVRQRFLVTLTAMHASGAASGRISDDDYADMLARLGIIAAQPISASEMWPASYLSPIQTCLISALADIVPVKRDGGVGVTHSELARWQLMLDWLCDQMKLPECLSPIIRANPKDEGREENPEVSLENQSDGGSQKSGHGGNDEFEGSADGGGGGVGSLGVGGQPGQEERGVEGSAEEEAVHPPPPPEPPKPQVPHGSENEPANRLLWSKAILEASVKLLKEKVPVEVAGEMLLRTAGAATALVGLRWCPGYIEWGSAGRERGRVPEDVVAAVGEMVAAGLLGVDWMCTHKGVGAAEVVWSKVCDMFDVSLHAPKTVDGGEPSTPMTWRKSQAETARTAHWEPIEEGILACIVDTVLASRVYLPGGIRQRLVEMVAAGCAVDTDAVVATGGRLAYLCIRKLCAISGRGAARGHDTGLQETHLEVAKLALPLLLAHCRSITSSLLATDAAVDQATLDLLNSHSYPPPGTMATTATQAPKAAASSPLLDATPAKFKNLPRVQVEMARQEGDWGDDGVGEEAGQRRARRTLEEARRRLGVLEGLAEEVLRECGELRVASEVVDGALPGARDLRMAVNRLQNSRIASAVDHSRGEQVHLFVIYWEVVSCCKVGNRSVREAAMTILQIIGHLLPVGHRLLAL